MKSDVAQCAIAEGSEFRKIPTIGAPSPADEADSVEPERRAFDGAMRKTPSELLSAGYPVERDRQRFMGPRGRFFGM